MAHESTVTDSDMLRRQLMAPDLMQRVAALHSLELEAECACDQRPAVAHAAARFAARGIPFYALHDPHYKAWVGKAVDYWQRLHAGSLPPAAGVDARAVQRP